MSTTKNSNKITKTHTPTPYCKKSETVSGTNTSLECYFSQVRFNAISIFDKKIWMSRYNYSNKYSDKIHTPEEHLTKKQSTIYTQETVKLPNALLASYQDTSHNDDDFHYHGNEDIKFSNKTNSTTTNIISSDIRWLNEIIIFLQRLRRHIQSSSHNNVKKTVYITSTMNLIDTIIQTRKEVSKTTSEYNITQVEYTKSNVMIYITAHCKLL